MVAASPSELAADDGPELDPTLSALAELMARRRSGRSIACAESFTAGLLCQSLAAVDGSGDWFPGGIVTYATEQKRAILGVRAASVISEACAIEMALGAARLFGADAAVSSTGVAGPEEQEGRPPGTIVVGWAVDGRAGATTLELRGGPEEVIHRGVRTALTALSRAMVDIDSRQLC